MSRTPFRDELGLLLLSLRRSGGFAGLPRAPWLAFIAIACHWRAHAEAWPSQQTIGAFGDYSERAVRDAVAELEERGIVRMRRARARNSERIYYAPGPTTLREVGAFEERFPRRARDGGGREQAEAGSGCPAFHPEMASAGTRQPVPGNSLREIKNQLVLVHGGTAPTAEPEEGGEREERAEGAERADAPVPLARIQSDLTQLFGANWRARGP